MILFYGANGTLIKVVPEHVYQGSDAATTLYFVAPIPNTAVISVAFELPNGDRTAKHLLTNNPDDLNGIQDSADNTYRVWAYALNGYETAYVGTLTAQFFIAINGITRTTEAVDVTIEDGVAPEVQPMETRQYDEIIALLSTNYYTKAAIDDMLDEYYTKTEIDANYYDKIAIDGALAGKQDSLSESQMSAVNSGIDSTKVAKITANENAISEINSKIPSTASSSNKLVDKAQMDSALADKQDVLTFDDTPTSGSNNPVKSGGIYTALGGKVDKTQKIAGIGLSGDISASDLKTALGVSSVYKPHGSATVTELNALTKTASMDGYVYNVTTDGTLDNGSGNGTQVKSGDNVALIWNNGAWAWDRLSATVDLSHYVPISREIAGIDLYADISSARLTEALTYDTDADAVNYVMGD